MEISRQKAMQKHFILDKMLPVSELDFYNSEWHKWLDWINAGLESENKKVEESAKGKSEECQERLADKYYEADKISSNMYAALIVSIWARIEHFFQNLCDYCECFGLPKIEDKVNIKGYDKYFKDNLEIDMRLIDNINEVNMLRVLSNSFKHNDCHYESDSYPIDKTVAAQYAILEDRPIKYLSLPIKELILNAGAFCQELFNKTDKALKKKTNE